MNTRPIPIRRLVFLVGFMGSGKTSVGRLLAERLGWGFADLDEEIERRLGRTINQIFAEQGEVYFRRVERQVLEDFLRRAEQEALVVALGGGTFAQPENVEWLRANGGVTFWLACPVEELIRRCRGMTHRPLFRDPASFRQLYEQRLPHYQRADFCVDADRSDPAQVVEGILKCGVI
ncbi:MAG TPA: shikimate kinase [Candidatus Acidoferrales bacterium]|nr:shikimate kinase [Candidatus Acidoferrales bacterium]